MSKVLSFVRTSFNKHPIISNGVIYGTLFFGAEFSQQLLTKKILTDEPIELDKPTLGRYAFYGTAIQGPLLTVWYRWLDSKFVGTALKTVGKKLLVDQFISVPPLLLIFYVSMSIMERKSDVLEEFKSKFPQTFKNSCMFWMPVQTVNFLLVPPAFRVIYIGTASFAWMIPETSPIFYFLCGFFLCLILNPNQFLWKKKSIIVSYLAMILIVIPSLIATTSAFWLYRQLINLILTCRVKRKYRGLLSGPDRFWLLDDNSNPVINMLMFMRPKRQLENYGLYRSMRERIDKLLIKKHFWKLHCTTAKFMGYDYLLTLPSKNENIKKLDSAFYANEAILRETISSFCSNDIADGQLWEIMIGDEEIPWGKSNCYLAIVRFHQCLGDVMALLQMLRQLFECAVDDAEEEKIKEGDTVQKIVKIMVRCVGFLVVLGQIPHCVSGRLLKAARANPLHGFQLTGDNIVSLKVESGYRYLSKVKTIKRKLQVTVFDIISAAFGYSFDKFFQQKGKQISDVSVEVPAVGNSQNLQDNVCTNRFSMGILDLPVSIPQNLQQPYSSRCMKTNAEVVRLKVSQQFQVNYWFREILGTILPDYMLRPLLNSIHSTLILSHLPGPRRIQSPDGDSIEDIIFWVPHKGLTGVGISVLSYDDRL